MSKVRPSKDKSRGNFQKRLVLFVNSLWNVKNFRIPLISELLNSGFSITILAPKDCDPDFLSRFRTIDYIAIRNLSRKGTNPLMDLRLILELKSIFKRIKPEIILNFTIKPVIYGSIASGAIPNINTITGLGYSFLSKGMVNFIVKSLYRYAFKHSSTIIFQNEDDLELFNKLNLINEPQAGVINGSGIDSSEFRLAPIPNKDKNSLNVLFVGRMLRDKGVVELLDAAEELVSTLPNIHFTLVGGTDSNNPASLTDTELNQRLSTLPNVTYHGQVHDTKKYYMNAHILILPSYREGLPRVVLEAMATGRPVVVADVPGCRQTVFNHKNGVLIPVKSSKAIVDSLSELSTLDQEILYEMGMEGRKMVEEIFDSQIINKAYVEIIQRLLII